MSEKQTSFTCCNGILTILGSIFVQAAYAVNTVVATITVGNVPVGVAYDSAKGEIFVANSGGNTVSVIDDTTNAITTITNSSFSSPIGVAYDSAKGEIFVANSGGNTVSVIDDTTNAILTTIGVGAAPAGIAYDSAKGEIFVANSADNTVSVISDGSSSSSTSGGHSVVIHHPPSLGNDYYYKYPGGFTQQKII